MIMPQCCQCGCELSQHDRGDEEPGEQDRFKLVVYGPLRYDVLRELHASELNDIAAVEAAMAPVRTADLKRPEKDVYTFVHVDTDSEWLEPEQSVPTDFKSVVLPTTAAAIEMFRSDANPTRPLINEAASVPWLVTGGVEVD
eukprot:m.328894 g.328894  ORF g.328894 m.328894 type:complete len:142 (-) comp16502_c1_seq47:119-544(-)